MQCPCFGKKPFFQNCRSENCNLKETDMETSSRVQEGNLPLESCRLVESEYGSQAYDTWRAPMKWSSGQTATWLSYVTLFRHRGGFSCDKCSRNIKEVPVCGKCPLCCCHAAERRPHHILRHSPELFHLSIPFSADWLPLNALQPTMYIIWEMKRRGSPLSQGMLMAEDSNREDSLLNSGCYKNF